MISLGLNETLTYVLINEKDVKKYTLDEFEELKLLDPITEERNVLRYSLIPSLVKTYEYNIARNIKDVSIFEIGKGFYKKQEYGEDLKLCCLMTGEYILGINNKKQVDFYIIKGIAEEILNYLGYENRYTFTNSREIPKEFHPGQTGIINVNNDNIGIIGRLHPSITKEAVYVLEINLDRLLDKKVGKMKFKEISKYPNIEKDLAVVAKKEIASLEIEKAIKKSAGNLLIDIKPFDLYEGKGIQEGERSIAYSLTFGAKDRTLVDEEINNIMSKIIENLENKLNVKIRK